eukprot:gene45912-61369_t
MAGDFVVKVVKGSNNFFTPAQSAKALQAGPMMLDMLRRAHQGGVKIAFGTDTGVSAHGDNAYEFVLMTQAGMTPLQTIQAATVNAADHLQLSTVAGRLAPGYSADLIAVSGDPLKDVTTLQKVGDPMLDRRKLLIAATASAALPATIARAAGIDAHVRKGTIEDVEHVVILMQENRSFDHYFGTLKGVRGFGDPRVVKLPSGKPAWYQPNGGTELLPFRPPVQNLGLTFLPDPPHGWTDTHAAWNQGRHDQWVPNKGLSAMTYHVRRDIPYHFALADAFTAIATEQGVTPAQLSLAWVLSRGPHVVVIPGTAQSPRAPPSKA